MALPSDSSGDQGDGQASIESLRQADTERTWSSYLPGTGAGDRAATHWANRLVAAGGGFFDDPVAATGSFFSVLWTDQTAADTAFTLGGGGIAKGMSWALGPAKQWFRLKGSYSHAMGQKTLLTLSFGASPRHLNKIPTQLGQNINKRFRSLKIPGSSWRTQDAGHIHLKK
jgi:hypothetical protein